MDFSKLGTAAAESDDLTQNKVFDRPLPREGVALLRLRDYVELGRHESNVATYKPALKVLLTFELNHPDHMVEFDGKQEPSIITIRLNKGGTAKSGYKKLFNVMNKACGGQCHHFVQMIGKAFLGEIYHNTNGEGDKKKTYANLDLDGAWSLKAPVQVDTLTNTKTAIPVTELHGIAKAFLWENPSIEDADVVAMWDSIFIEGEREVEDAKTKTKKTVSKNWIQETIMKNIEWEGSTTQALTQEHITLEEHTADAPKEEPKVENKLGALAGVAVEDEVPNLDD